MTQEELIGKIEALIAEVKLPEPLADLDRAATPTEINRVVSERALLALIVSIKLNVGHLFDAHTAIFVDEINRICAVETLNALIEQ